MPSRPRSISGCSVRVACSTYSPIADDADRQQQDRGARAAPGRGRCVSKPKTRPSSPTALSRKPQQVERRRPLLAHVRDEQRDQHDAEHADRHVDPEDPAPVEIGRDEAAERRARASGRSAPAWSARPSRAPGRALGTERSSTSRPTGTIIAPPMPCRVRASTSCQIAVAKPHRIEPSMKTTIASAEHAARAEPVGDPAADRDEHREREQVGRDREAERERALAERGRDRRQRRRQRGRIEVLHEQRAGDDQRDQHEGRLEPADTVGGACEYGPPPLRGREASRAAALRCPEASSGRSPPRRPIRPTFPGRSIRIDITRAACLSERS